MRWRAGARRSRRFRGSRRGVVAVVGTLLALLVFFALFGVFLTQYVPLWMEENESALANDAQASLATLKSGVDDQYLLGQIPTYAVPFTTSSASVPLLAQPTVATLSYVAGCPGGLAANGTPKQIGSCDFQRLAWTTGGAVGAKNNPYVQTLPTNFFQVTLPNRYYVPVTYFFEDDAIAQAQSATHQVLVAPPPLNITKTGTTVSVQSSLLAFAGASTSFSGEGSKVVTASLVSASSNSSTGRFVAPTGTSPRTFNVTLTLGVHDVCAWYNLLYNSTASALGASGSGVWTLTGAGPSGPIALPPTSSVCGSSASTTYDLTLTIFGVSSAFTYLAQVQLTFNAGGI